MKITFGANGMEWKVFRVLFLDHYFLEVVWDSKREEFLTLV